MYIGKTLCWGKKTLLKKILYVFFSVETVDQNNFIVGDIF